MNLISKCQSKPCDPLWPLLAEYSEVGSGVKLLIRTSLHYSGLDSFHKLELGSFWRVWYILCLFLTRTSTCMSSLHKVLWTLVSLLVLQFDTARLAHSETRTLQSACFHDCNVCFIRAREPGNGGIWQPTWNLPTSFPGHLSHAVWQMLQRPGNET